MKSFPVILLLLTPVSLVYSPLYPVVKIDPVTHRAIAFDRVPEFTLSACLSLAIISGSIWLTTLKVPRPVLLAVAASANLLLLWTDVVWMIG